MFEKIFTSFLSQIGPVKNFSGSRARIFFKLKWSDNSGQGILEYVLLLVVIVAIVFGLVGKFYKPFGNFANSVVKGKLECALEMGELMDSDVLKNEGGQCIAQYSGGTWNIKNSSSSSSGSGKGSSGSNGSNSNNSNSNNGNDSSKQNDKSSGDKSSSKDGSKSDKGGASAGGDSGSSDQGSSNSSGRSLSGPQRSNGVVGRNGKVNLSSKSSNGDNLKSNPETNVSLEGSGADDGWGSMGQRARSLNRRKTKPIVINEQTSKLLKKKSADKKNQESVKINNISEANDRKPKQIKIQSSLYDKKIEDKKESWDLGKMFRIAIIVLIILAILIFLFFQISQFARSFEKN